MLDPIVQSAFVVIVAWLLKLLAAAVDFPLDETALNTLAVAIVAFILSRLGVPVVRAILPESRRGLLSKEDK